MMKKNLFRLFFCLLLLCVTIASVPVCAIQSDSPGEIKVYLDGEELIHPDVQPCIMGDRTMVPIYQLSKALGAEVIWDGDTSTVTLTRAGTIVRMTIDSKTAYVDGKPVAMDVAPCILEGRTMIPAAYVALFFGQIVSWDGEARAVSITEDKSVAGDSNLEAWAIPMGFYLSASPQFGGYSRAYIGNNDGSSASIILSASWNIHSRQELVDTVLSMTVAGHNANFLHDAAVVNSLSSAEYQQLLEQAQGIDAYMWPYTKALSEKWGERGILCWDLFRMSNLVQWGYQCGYVTYAEALALLEPAATALQENFDSWDEAYENYVDGYNWWKRNNVLDQNTWDTTRGQGYQRAKAQYGSQVFDDSLFHETIIPVPNLTIEDILATL